MPRRPRVFLEGGAYHVYCRVTRREPIFADHEASARFVDLVREVKQQDRFTVFAWCVMPTHYHLALRAGEVPLTSVPGPALLTLFFSGWATTPV